ncbi:MAG: HAMP domain-containing histidine kinase [Acidobacteria bacterium]|nr:HAMP domain-containing histidine kinase [Acidobacteriota bacterium]
MLNATASAVALTTVLDHVVDELGDLIRLEHALVEVGALPDVDGDPAAWETLFERLVAAAIAIHEPGIRPVVIVRRLGQRELPPKMSGIAVEVNGAGASPRDLAPLERIARHLGGSLETLREPESATRFLITFPSRPPGPTPARTGRGARSCTGTAWD